MLTVRIEVHICHITPNFFPLIVDFQWKELCIRDTEELLVEVGVIERVT